MNRGYKRIGNEIKMCCDPREAVPYNVCDSIFYKAMTSGDSFESIGSCVMPYFLCVKGPERWRERSLPYSM